MKKRAMKKLIPTGDFCYKLLSVETSKTGFVLKCKYCGNYYLGATVNDEMSDNLGGYIPIKRKKRMCRYMNTELYLEDVKMCGEKHYKEETT